MSVAPCAGSQRRWKQSDTLPASAHAQCCASCSSVPRAGDFPVESGPGHGAGAAESRRANAGLGLVR